MTTHQIPMNWMTTGEAATYCRISPRTLRRWTKANRVRAYDGKYFRDDLDRAVRNEPAGTPVSIGTGRISTADVRPDGSYSFRMPSLPTSPVTGISFAAGLGKSTMASALEIDQAVQQLRADGMSTEAALVIVKRAVELSRVSLLSFRAALDEILRMRTEPPTVSRNLTGIMISDTPIRWKALSPEETRMMDEHGTSQPNERPEREEGVAPAGCLCSFQPSDTSDGWTPDPGCPWPGERPYLACSKCNYDQHTCPGCGDNLKHGVSTCAECLAESAGSGGPENDAGPGAGALKRSPENPCPTCGAVYRAIRRHPMPSGQLMTGIGCTDPWHPRAPESEVVPAPGQ